MELLVSGRNIDIMELADFFLLPGFSSLAAALPEEWSRAPDTWPSGGAPESTT